MGITSWLPTITSIITLIVNIFFYICIQSKLGYEYKRKEDLAAVCAEFFTYLSEVVSYKDYDGVPTAIRNYSLRIHLCFKDGQADDEITSKLESLFQQAKERKTKDDNEIDAWGERFRTDVKELRCLLGKYCGGIKPI